MKSKSTFKLKIVLLGIFIVIGFWMVKGPDILYKLGISQAALCQKQCDKVHRKGHLVRAVKSARGVYTGPWNCECS